MADGEGAGVTARPGIGQRDDHGRDVEARRNPGAEYAPPMMEDRVVWVVRVVHVVAE